MPLYSATSPLPVNMERRRLFNPSRISGLQLWLDATKGLFDATSGGNPVTTDGATIARWEDQSSSGYHVTQATSANRPVLKTGIRNSKDAIRFDGVNDSLVSSNISANNLPAMTCFVVAYIAGFGGGGFGRYFDRSARIWLLAAAGANHRFSTVGLDHETALSSITTGNWYINSARWDGGTNIATNVSQRINKANSTRGLTGTGTNTSVANTSYSICNRPSGDRGFNGDIAELIIYNQALTTEQIDSVESYLSAKWGF